MRRFITLLLLCFSTFALAQVQVNQPLDSAQYQQAARIAWNNKDYKASIYDYTMLINLNNKNIIAYANRATAEWSIKDYENAIKDFNAAISLDKKYSWIYYNDIALVKVEEKDLKSAIENYSRSISLFPSGATYMNRGNAWLTMGDYKNAIKDYTTAITSFNLQRNGTNASKYVSRFGADPYVSRAKAEALSGDFKSALDDFNTAISINPDLPFAYNGRGEAKHNLGDTTGACADWQTAFKLGSKPAWENIQKYCGK